MRAKLAAGPIGCGPVLSFSFGFAGFSRTFVEVSNDDREVAARPKRQS